MTIIRELRKQRHMTMKELGRIIGVAESTISLYETGKREPDLETLTKIADVFGVTTDELLGRTTEDPDATQDEIQAIRERLRRDPDYRLLFATAKKAPSEHLKAAVAVLKALEPKDYDD